MKAIHNIFSIFMCALAIHTCFSETSFAGNTFTPPYIGPINFDPIQTQFGTYCIAGQYIATLNGSALIPAVVFYSLFIQSWSSYDDGDDDDNNDIVNNKGYFCWDINDSSKNFENMHKFLNGIEGDSISPCYKLSKADFEQLVTVLNGGKFSDESTLENRKVTPNGELPYSTYNDIATELKARVNPSNITCEYCPNNGLTDVSEATFNSDDNTWSWSSFQTIADCKKKTFEDNTGYYEYNTTSEGCYYGGTN